MADTVQPPSEQVIYQEWDISGWNDRARRFLCKYIESARSYGMQLTEHDPLDEYVIVRGTPNRLLRVQTILLYRYKEYPHITPIPNEDKLKYNSNLSYKDFLEKWKGQWGPDDPLEQTINVNISLDRKLTMP